MGPFKTFFFFLFSYCTRKTRLKKYSLNIDTENKLIVARWKKEGWGLGEIGEGIKKYQLAVTK